MSLLYVAAPIHHSYGVIPGPPVYAVETFPGDAFAVENETLFTAVTKSTNLAKLVTIPSASFGPQAASDTIQRGPTMNAFLAAQPLSSKNGTRPQTASTSRQHSQQDTESNPTFSFGAEQMPPLPFNRQNSGYTLQTSLREKRSGNFDSFSRRSESISERFRRKPSLPFSRHNSSPSNVSGSPSGLNRTSTYAISTYAQSTLATSTIMPGVTVQPAQIDENTAWVEGHCFQFRPDDGPSTCVICDDHVQDSYSRCSGCGLVVHPRCAFQVSVVCPAAFYPDQIRAAFVRCLAGVFSNYKKFMQPSMGAKRRFNFDAYIRSLPAEDSAYAEMLRETQAFNEFVSAQDSTDPSAAPSIALFDAVVVAKRNRRGRLRSGFSTLSLGRRRQPSVSSLSNSSSDILYDTSQHQWRIVNVPTFSDRPDMDTAAKGRDYHDIVTRMPAKLEDGFLQRRTQTREKPGQRNGSAPQGRAVQAQINGLNSMPL